jgi:hypothetical protein
MRLRMRNVSFASTALLLAVALAPATVGAQPRPGPGQPPAAQKGAPPPQAAPKQAAPKQAAPKEAAPQQPSPPKPYKPVAVKFAPPFSDPSLDTFRKEVAAVAQRKDRAALARMVVAKGFFWETEEGKGADAKKSSIDNLVAALGLDAKDGSGWAALAETVGEGNAAADPQAKGLACAPAPPELNEKDFEALIKATQTDAGEWSYPPAAGVEVRAAPQAAAPVVEKLGVHLVRVMVDDSPANAVQGASADWARIVAPSGKVGYVAASAINNLVEDQICYLKDASGWKITGVVGGG